MKSISLLSGYLFLISAIITGIAANGYLKTTEGFTKFNPTHGVEFVTNTNGRFAYLSFVGKLR